MILHLTSGAIVVNWFTGWQFTGHFTAVDLIAASTNALNGALLARRPDHYKNFTIVGVMCMALLGGLGGGITRDVLINKTPGAITNPAYITLAVVFGVVGYHLAFAKGQMFREGLFQFMTSFSLAWYAIAGAEAGLKANVPVLGTLVLAVVGPTAGRWYIDVSSGVTPKQFIRGEWFIGVALLTGLIWVVFYWLIVQQAGASIWWPTLIAFAAGFAIRMLALYRGWEEPLAREPRGVYKHDDGRPLLGRKIAGKSERELRDLGLVVENGAGQSAEGAAQPAPTRAG